MSHRLFLLLAFTIAPIILFVVRAQDGIQLNLPATQDGYVLVNSYSTTVLLDECGGIVNSWETGNPHYHVKLLPSGNIYYLEENTIYEQNWEGEIVVEIARPDPLLKFVYDIIKMTNGNYLVNCRRSVSTLDLDALGWDNSLGVPNIMDGIVEINPDGEIVWEWNISDHLIQDEYLDLDNYGVVSSHPERMDVQAVSSFDWVFGEAFMFNGFDYNEQLDQIIISARKANEIIIIDHSTTTEEAASSMGGRYGRGGDLLFRWGNPSNYTSAEDGEHYLHFQHNPNWIKYGEYAESIIVYSNNLDSESDSEIFILTPVIDSDGSYVMMDSIFLPQAPDRVISSLEISSNYTSGAVVMPNGNIYVTVGQEDRLIELDESDTPVWIYELPGFQYTYRSEKYAADFPAFLDRELVAQGSVEDPPSDYECSVITATSHLESSNLEVVVLSGHVIIDFCRTGLCTVMVHDVHGQLLYQQADIFGRHSIDLREYPSGLVVVTIVDDGGMVGSRMVYLSQ